MSHKDVYLEQLEARLEALADPRTAGAIVKFMVNFRQCCYDSKDQSGNMVGWTGPNHINGFLNTIVPNIIPTLLDVQVDFLPNNIVENLSEDIRKVKALLDGLMAGIASQNPPEGTRRAKKPKATPKASEEKEPKDSYIT